MPGLPVEAGQAASEIGIFGFGDRPHRWMLAGEAEGGEMGRGDENLLHDRLLGDLVRAVSAFTPPPSVWCLTL